jgi:hypothetical protein
MFQSERVSASQADEVTFREKPEGFFWPDKLLDRNILTLLGLKTGRRTHAEMDETTKVLSGSDYTTAILL